MNVRQKRPLLFSQTINFAKFFGEKIAIFSFHSGGKCCNDVMSVNEHALNHNDGQK